MVTDKHNPTDPSFMILDSGCTVTVVGKKVFESYICLLKERNLDASFNQYSEHSVFRFANGNSTTSLYSVRFPVYLNGVKQMFNAHVLSTPTPFLLSCRDMTKLGFVIDFDNGTLSCQSLGLNCFPLVRTRANQLCLPLFSLSSDPPCCDTFMVQQVTQMSAKDIEALRKPGGLSKVHKNLNHISVDKMCMMFKHAGAPDDIISSIKDLKCETCWKHKKPYLKPITGGFLALNFNDFVVLDLMEYKFAGKKVLVAVFLDIYSR